MIPPEESNPPCRLRVGTSSFTASGWDRTFYPSGLKKGDYLAFYATQFDTLEIDSTFYGAPSRATTERWNRVTPPGFTFALKAPQEITHERGLVHCDDAMNAFLDAVEPLESKLGAILLQFPYFNASKFPSAEPFLALLRRFVEGLSQDFRFVVEIRNRHWLAPPLLDLLSKHEIGLAMIDHPWMPRPAGLLAQIEPVTSGPAYIRLLGDRHAIEERTRIWDVEIVDRSTELAEWITLCKQIRHRGEELHVYVNNHYAGHAPATARSFRAMWENTSRAGTE